MTLDKLTVQHANDVGIDGSLEFSGFVYRGDSAGSLEHGVSHLITRDVESVIFIWIDKHTQRNAVIFLQGRALRPSGGS